MAASPYSGNSIVDYLSSVGQDSSYGNRSNIYKSSGLNLGNYTGSAQQNTALLGYLRGGSAAPASTPAPSPMPSPSPSIPTPSAPPTTSRVDYVAAQQQEVLKKQAEQQAKVDASRKALTVFYATLEDPTTRYKRLSDEQGVSEQQALVNALTRQSMEQTDLLEGIDPSVTERSKDFFVNEADRVALVARESDPVMKNLNKILRNKQYEEIGLAGKQQLVKDLLTLSIQGDEQRAKPLVLGVDYSERDMKDAMDLLSSLTNTRVNAFNADLTSYEQKQASDLEWQRTLEKMQKSQDYAKELETLSSNNQLARSLATKSASKAEDTTARATESAWNSMLAEASTEYDIWKNIDQNQAALRNAGIDVDELWAKHAALAGKVGKGGSIRSSSGSGTLTPEQLLQALQ